jgi:hypothetical protein
MLLALLIVACSLGLTVVAGAQNEPESEKGSHSSRGVSSVDPQTTTICDGSAQNAVVQNLNDAPVSKAEGNTVAALPGSALPVFVPTGDGDIVTVTLTGEAAMTGASDLDRIEMQARMDGVPMEPRPDLVGFHSGNGQDSNSAMWCQFVGEGSHTVEIFWRALDVAPLGTVTGTMDEYIVRAEVSE